MSENVERVRGLGQAAAELKKKPHQLDYAFAAGHVEEPKARLFGKRLIDDETMERLREYFGRQMGRGRPAKEPGAA
jgi:hypothetical protein